MEFDHLFICLPPPADAADLLTQFGLTEGTPRVHPGQGTANRRFFFRNAFIEFLYLTSADEAQSPLTKPTRLYERLSSSKHQAVSPFGVCFRPGVDGDSAPPFPHWVYRPAYLPPELTIPVAEAPLSEPMWFFLPFGHPPEASPPAQRQPLSHPAGFEALTRLHLHVNSPEPLSEAARMIGQHPHIEIESASEALVEIEFDQATQGKSQDFRPALPLRFRW